MHEANSAYLNKTSLRHIEKINRTVIQEIKEGIDLIILSL